MSELRPRTPLEQVHEEVFDPESGLIKRVDDLEEEAKSIAAIKSFIKTLRWPLGILALAILQRVGQWLVALLWGGP